VHVTRRFVELLSFPFFLLFRQRPQKFVEEFMKEAKLPPLFFPLFRYFSLSFCRHNFSECDKREILISGMCSGTQSFSTTWKTNYECQKRWGRVEVFHHTTEPFFRPSSVHYKFNFSRDFGVSHSSFMKILCHRKARQLFVMIK
jgi:hypothetical protein